MIDYSKELNRRYWVDKNGLSLIERSLERLDKLETKDVYMNIAISKTINDLTFFLYNELYSLED
jgi:hypothetical protein